MLESLIQSLIAMFQGNPLFLQIVAYLMVAWIVVTTIRNVGLFVTHLTKSSADDAWWNKWIVKPIAFIEPFIKFLPHSTFQLGKAWDVIVKVAGWIKGLFPDQPVQQ